MDMRAGAPAGFRSAFQPIGDKGTPQEATPRTKVRMSEWFWVSELFVAWFKALSYPGFWAWVSGGGGNNVEIRIFLLLVGFLNLLEKSLFRWPLSGRGGI